MFFLFSTLLNSFSYVLALLPLLAVWFLLPAHRGVSHKFRLGILLLTVYLCGVAAVTGLPTLRYGFQFDTTINLIPFHHFFADTMQFLLNIMMFLPLGIFLPLFWERCGRLKETAGFGFLLSLLIEISQLFCFRVTDLNDLFMNTLGSVLGWFIWKKLLRGYSLHNTSCSPWSIVALVWVAALFLQGFVSDFLWNQFYH